jgi:hypothetical protein
MTKRFKGGVMSGTVPSISTTQASAFWNLIDDATNMNTQNWPGLQYIINFLVVGGGGGGGYGGGGGGGVVIGSTSITPGVQVAITVGLGGAGVTYNPNGNNGGSSSIVYTSIINIVGLGGGGGGAVNSNGLNGGSGGGGGGNNNGVTNGGSALQTSQSQTTFNGTFTNYGNNGTGNQPYGGYMPSGIGGGAGDSSGNGLSSTFTGLSVTYAAGGANSGGFASTSGSNGNVNTGNGGGGSSGNSGTIAGNGGSGIVIISYPSPIQRATGGVITSYTIGPLIYWVHTFLASGTYNS